LSNACSCAICISCYTSYCCCCPVITAPLVGLLSAILVDAGEQIVGALFVTVNTGPGLTTTLTFCVVPVQVTPAFVNVGVTAYVTVIGEFVVFINCCAIDEPLPALAPVEPPVTTVQLNTVPATVLLNAILLLRHYIYYHHCL
jgi:hypothetical protein